MLKLERATIEHAEEIRNIYQPYITDTSITFECDVPTAEEFAQRIIAITKTYPWIVCKDGESVVGYAYASTHNARAAYRWSVNTSVYVLADYHGQGVATALYSALFELLKQQGFTNAYAGITVPNEKSMRLHEKFGFHPVGTYKNVGYKMGEWHDVIWLEKHLMPCPNIPLEPCSMNNIDAEAILKKFTIK